MGIGWFCSCSSFFDYRLSENIENDWLTKTTIQNKRNRPISLHEIHFKSRNNDSLRLAPISNKRYLPFGKFVIDYLPSLARLMLLRWYG